MSSEQIRLILTEVEKFLSETLKKENKLSKKTVEQKQALLDKLKKFYEDNPQLKPVASQDTISVHDESSITGGTEGSSTSRSDGSEDTTYNEAGIGMIAAADLKSPVMSGWLEKKQKKGTGLFGGKFQKRWCVIQAGIFYYYANQKDKQQNGSFTLEGYKFRNAPDLSSKKTEKELCFELYPPNESKRTYQMFMAKSKAEYDQWENAMAAGGYPLIEEDIYEMVGEGLEGGEGAADEPAGEDYEEPDGPKPPPVPSPMTIHKPPPPPPSDDMKPTSNVAAFDEGPEEIYDDAITPETTNTEELPPPIHSKPPHTHADVALPPVPPPMKRPNRDLPPPPPEKKRVKISLKFKPQEDFENRFYGKWDCTGESSNELTFKKGDIIHVLSRDFDDKSWWVGELDGKFGLVPKDYLTPAFTPVA